MFVVYINCDDNTDNNDDVIDDILFFTGRILFFRNKLIYLINYLSKIREEFCDNLWLLFVK